MNAQDLHGLLWSGSVRDIGHAIQRRQTTCVAVARWYLERIEARNVGPSGLNAIRTVSATAIADAERLDEELSSGMHRGPLHGVPFVVKDNIMTREGMPCSAGAMALADFVPLVDATLVKKLRAAGGVLLGKSNMTEFADFVSDVMPAEFSGAGGVVQNPLGPPYGRGQGSSVGSAATVSARLAAFAIGTETQNSIQTPAVHSSVVGFKPTVGRVSRHGIIPLVPSQDTAGVLALCVDDAALVLEAMAGADVRDTATLGRGDDLQASTGASTLHGIRIGVVSDLVPGGVTQAQLSTWNQMLKKLGAAGAVVTDPCDLPSAAPLAAVRSCVFRTEFKESLNVFLEEYRPCGFESLDELVRWNAANERAIPYGQSLLLAAAATDGLATEHYRHDREQDLVLALGNGILAAFETHAIDVLLAPMTTAAKCTGKAGAPVLAIPVGADAQGAPFGITLFVEPGADARLLRIGRAVESAIGQRLVPPI